MAPSEQQTVEDICQDLLQNGIIRESSSNYCSPILLVKKKNGEPRMCIDYRKLNSLTVRQHYPLPRIDDQINRLHDGVYFTSLDLRSGYYQVPISETSKKYTSFITPNGQYELNRVGFGLTNAPHFFQKVMNMVLQPCRDFASVYLDDILLHSKTLEVALTHLTSTLKLFRESGLTLNLSKCSFLMTSVNFLEFEVSAGSVKPGRDKCLAVENFPTPKSVHNVRQFLGLTGYFRHFIKDYATLARPLSTLLKKDKEWSWSQVEDSAFQQLKTCLASRPTLMLYQPNAITEVHTDASSLGLGGILLQKDGDRFHPVAYFSRHTQGAERNYHSYELETLAVVDTLKKFRVYLLGTNFTVVTDCNSLKQSANKKELIPRIARWWLQLLEFTFTIEHRPGERMRHVDALSRNPADSVEVLRIETDDWVLAGQLSDEQLQAIRTILTKPPVSTYDHHIYKNYALRDNRLYRTTAKGLLWVVPKGMRHEVVRTAHEEVGHSAVEKTLKKLSDTYWFPKMRPYIENFIKCCIPCLYAKRKSGKPECLLNPIPKGKEPLDTLHIDHLGPFPKSKLGNQHLIVAIDAFTKFSFLRAVKSTKTKPVIEYLRDIFASYGVPKVIISDQGTAFTANRFQEFCTQNHIKHLKTAVATPRANGQVERLNRNILNALLASTTDEDLWDAQVRRIQFAINNTINSSTNKTPSQLLLGYEPRGGEDSLLRDEVRATSRIIGDIIKLRTDAARSTTAAQERQKQHHDKRHKPAACYKVGDLVLIEKQTATAPGTSRKLVRPFQGPMIVAEVLGNDRYRVQDMEGTRRVTRQKANYDRVIAADRMKLWRTPGGVSDSEEAAESDGDGIVLSSESDTSEAD